MMISGLGIVFAATTCRDPSLPCSGANCGGGEQGGDGGGGGEPVHYELTAPVEIVRDGDGVVHLYGETDADVFYASGYMQATDRLFQMDINRRQIYGRRAEVLGASFVADDALIRRLNVVPWGEANAQEAKQQSAEQYALVSAWAAGVNARIAEVLAGDAPMPLGFEQLGFEPEPWRPEDAFVIGKTILFENGNQLEYDLLASVIRAYKPDLYDALPFYSPIFDEFILGESEGPPASPVPDTTKNLGGWKQRPLPADAAEKLQQMQRQLAGHRPRASNNWAVAPELTESGRSMLCGDPHQPLRSPSLMWLHHMNSKDAGGRVDIVGWSFVGTPGVSLGHNDKLAWTATTNYPDVTDVWDVEVIEGKALVGGREITIETREEVIAVKDAEPTTITVEIVPGYGVLLPNDLIPLPLVDVGHRLLFNWTGYRVTHEPQGFFRFGTSQSVDDFDDAVDTMELASFNFVAASADEITYRSSPIVPDRGDPARHAPAYALLDGSDPDTLWTGELLSLDQMPHSRGGADGLIVTANNDPFGFTADGSLSNDPYYFGAYYDPGTRAGRAHQRLRELAEAGPLTVEDMQGLQMDAYSLVADEILPSLFEAWAKVPTDESLAAFRDRPELEEMVSLLQGWDRRMTSDAVEPVLFEFLMALYIRNVIGDDLGIFFEPISDNSPIYGVKFGLLAARQASSELVQGGRDLVVLTSLSDAAALLTERFGNPTAGFVWGDFHVSGFPSESIPELDGGSYRSDGAEGTVNVSEASFFSGGMPKEYHVSTGGALFRLVATFDEDGTPRIFYTMAGGSSGQPGAEHFNDLTDDWVAGNYRPLHFKRADVDAAAAESFKLE